MCALPFPRQIYLHGATVTRWRTSDGKERIWMSDEANFEARCTAAGEPVPRARLTPASSPGTGAGRGADRLRHLRRLPPILTGPSPRGGGHPFLRIRSFDRLGGEQEAEVIGSQSPPSGCWGLRGLHGRGSIARDPGPTGSSVAAATAAAGC